MAESITHIDELHTPTRTGCVPIPERILDTLQPRAEHDSLQSNIEHPRPTFNIPETPEDWRFNDLLDEIATIASDDHLERFKGLFKGHGRGSIGKRRMERCPKCAQFLNALRDDEYISRDNLLYLQKFLYIINDKNLIQKCIDYCREEGQLYFYKAPEQPEPGCRYVRFHLEGRDLERFEQEHIISVRDKVAKIICIPPEYVSVAGIGPSSSLCVTLMIPEIYVAVFQEMLEQNQPFPTLCELNIDFIYIDAMVYNITGIENVEIIQTEQQRRIMEIYDQFEDVSEQLERTKMKNDTLRRELDEAKSNYSVESERATAMESSILELEVTLDTLKTMSMPESNGNELSAFRKELRHADIPATLREPIRQILKSNTDIVSSCTRKMNENEIRKLTSELNNTKEKNLDLERQLEVHRYLSYRSVSEVNLLQTLRLYIKDISLERFEKIVDSTKAISCGLTKSEQQQIQSEYEWPNNDEIMAYMQDSEKLFLIGIICKEYKKNSTNVDVDSIISDILNKVKRNDLLEKYKGEVVNLRPRDIFQTPRGISYIHHFSWSFEQLCSPRFSQGMIQPYAIGMQRSNHFFQTFTGGIRSFVFRSMQT